MKLFNQDVNWARAGLGLPLLDDAAERKPGAVPVGKTWQLVYQSLSVYILHSTIPHA